MYQSINMFAGRQEFRRGKLLRGARPRHRHFDNLLDLAGVRFKRQDAIGQIDRLIQIMRDKQHGNIDIVPDLQ